LRILVRSYDKEDEITSHKYLINYTLNSKGQIDMLNAPVMVTENIN
jgi:hypothetical protein